MNVPNTLIDEEGVSWPVGSYDLRLKYRAVGGNFDLENYLVRNMGFCRLSEVGRSIRVTFRPATLGAATLGALFSRLSRGDYIRFVLEILDDEPRYELIVDIEDAAARIIKVGAESEKVRRPRFFQQPLNIAALQDTRHRHLRAMFKLWRSSAGVLDAKLRERVLSLRTGRVLLARIERGAVTLEHIGTGYTAISSPDYLASRGKQLKELPDHDYGNWVTDAFLDAVADPVPKLELIEAELNSGSSPVSIRYDRLILPWTDRGASFVTSCSVIRTAFSVCAT